MSTGVSIVSRSNGDEPETPVHDEGAPDGGGSLELRDLSTRNADETNAFLDGANDNTPEDEVMAATISRRKHNRRESVIELKELPHNLYSVMFLAALDSNSFTFATIVFMFQAAMISLALVDLIDMDNEKNPLKVPEDVVGTIRAAQGLALILAVAVQNDLKQSIQMLHAGYDPSITNRLPDATFTTWMIAYIAQLLVGSAFLAVIFVLVVRSSSVIEIFLNFAALAFISEIDDVFFELGLQGFFEESIRDTCKLVDEQRVPIQKRRYPLHRIIMTFTLLGMLGGWCHIIVQQFSGYYICKSILVQFGDAYHATLPTHSGTFVKKGTHHLDGRQVYISREYEGDLASYFRYCHKHKAWVFQVMDYADATSVDQICDDYLMISKQTETFNLLRLSSASDWKIRTFGTKQNILSSLEVPVDHFYMQCVTCGSGNCNGPCHNDRCICDDSQFGERCEFDDVCPAIGIDSRTRSFSSTFIFLSETFIRLDYRDESTNTTTPVRVNHRPVYIDEYVTDYPHLHELVMFNGRRWMIMDSNRLATSQELAEAFRDESFHILLANDFQSVPLYLSSTVDLATPSNVATPTGLSWFRRGSVTAQDYSVGQPIDSRFLCEVCDAVTNACFNDLACNDGKCECLSPVTATTGALCEKEASCLDEPCQNGGICDATTGVCDCEGSFVGVLCQIHLCLESDQICFNKATSCNADGSCNCTAGYIGETCGIFDCSDASICKNGGTCTVVNGCDCSDTFFEGTFCDIPLII